MHDAVTIHVEREDGELLVLDALGLVQGFLAGDLSAGPGGYNELAGRGDPRSISLDDVVLVNSTMRSRSEHARWLPIIESNQRWLSRIPGDLDIVEADDETWASARGDQLVNEAIDRCTGPGIGLASATKVLHLKRPRLFPVLDELVLQMMGVPVPTSADARKRAAPRLIGAIRREAQRNVKALRHIQKATATEETRLSLVRILDIALWFSHPAAGVDGVRREIAVSLRGRASEPSRVATGSRIRHERRPSAQPETRVVLLGCVKVKLEHRARAKDLYISSLWRGRRAYAEAVGCPWLILSAKYDLLDPEKRVAPYNVALAELPASARRAWGERVVAALDARFGSVDGMTFELHAGWAYRAAIAPQLRELGAAIEEPLLGLPIGRQLAWYRDHTSAANSDAAQRRRHATPNEVRRALDALEHNPTRVPASAWPADLPRLDQPGLYSWWVDQSGARMLSQGLGHRLKRGRIYAGQTGATKWPSGTAVATTLGERIGANHLNGTIRGSTFRLTLAAILASSKRLTADGAGRLDRDSEQRLSHWMRTHLAVAVHPFADRDALGDLEEQVLDDLDPPLNLSKRPATAIRARLTDMRRLL